MATWNTAPVPLKHGKFRALGNVAVAAVLQSFSEPTPMLAGVFELPVSAHAESLIWRKGERN